jgi:hypothetical protein
MRLIYRCHTHLYACSIYAIYLYIYTYIYTYLYTYILINILNILYILNKYTKYLISPINTNRYQSIPIRTYLVEEDAVDSQLLFVRHIGRGRGEGVGLAGAGAYIDIGI